MPVFALVAVVFSMMCAANVRADPPEPFGPIPSARQLAWQDLEYYAFVHFNMNTFTTREWGTGQEPPETFNPTELDCRQWARVCKDAGMKGIIITAKHHDGFCMWPSALSEHTVANSPWRDGEGDLLAELSEACAEFGLKFGVYMSPWDRNCAVYGDSPKYNAYFKAQLTEVLTNYGDVFEVWFDGANGEGPNGKRQEYDWPAFIATVREHQPDAVIFSDAGPDIRWVGNERGYAGETNWAPLRRDEFFPGTPRYRELTEGHADGTHWLPAECDVSIRPGWYYHAEQDDKVKTLDELLEIYYASVGRNGSFLLNLPVDRRGLVHENDVARLMELRAALDVIFDHDLAGGALASATNVREGNPEFGAGAVLDGNDQTYWATDDGVTSASIEIDLGQPTTLNHVVTEEYIALGQRVEAFSVEALVDGDWTPVARGTTIGNKRILRTPTVEAERIRINVEKAKACPTIASVSLFASPPTVAIEVEEAAFIGETAVTLKADRPGAGIHYTLDGSIPSEQSQRYVKSIRVTESVVVSAIAVEDGRSSIEPVQLVLTCYKESDFRPSLRFIRAPDPGLSYNYFEGGWQSLTDMAHAEAVGTGTTDSFSLEARQHDEHFALRFQGFVHVDRDGLYTFFTKSDDGSQLFIGEDLVVNNDGLHGMDEQSGVVALQAGYHPIEVTYFNATGGMGLEVSFGRAGSEKRPVPPEWLFH